MYDIEECIARYRRILQLLEEEDCVVERTFKGDLLVAYRKLLNQEMELLQNAMKQLWNNY